MIKETLILLLIASAFFSCKPDPVPFDQASKDSTDVAIDTLVSDIDWGDEEDSDESYSSNAEEDYNFDDNASSSSSSNYSSSSSESSRPSGPADDNSDVLKYQDYSRSDNSKQELVNALIFPAIRMVYSDNFAKPKAKVLSADKAGERHTMEVEITWKDRWTPKYEIKGILEVNEDGSDAVFKITDKNVAAEVLELTEDSFKSELQVANL